MITPHQAQIARRLHHELAERPLQNRWELMTDELRALLNAMTFALGEVTRLEDQLNRRLIHRAETRLAIFDPQPELETTPTPSA